MRIAKQLLVVALFLGLTGLQPVTAAATTASVHRLSLWRAPTRSLSGVVLDARGARSFRGVSVRLVSLATGRAAETVTEAGSSFRLVAPQIPVNHGDDRFQLTISSPGFFSICRIVSLRRSQSSMRLVLKPDAGSIDGRVESAHGHGVSGAIVRLTSEATGLSHEVKTDAHGSYRLAAPALPSPSATRAYELVVKDRSLIASRLVEIEPGTAPSAAMRLPPQGSSLRSLRTGFHRARASTPRLLPRNAKPSRLGDNRFQSLRAHLGRRAVRSAVSPTPVPGCPLTGSTTWTGAVSGAWESSFNWTNGVPTSSTYACITDATVNADVTINSSASAAGLLLGGSNSLEIQAGSLTLAGSTTDSAIQGGLTVDSGTTMDVASGSTLLNASGGSITNQGSFFVDGGFEQQTGTVATGSGDNPVVLRNNSTLTFSGNGAGAFDADDGNNDGSDSFTVNLAGNIASGQSLDIQVVDYCHGNGATTISPAGSFTNAGTISEEYDSQGCNDNNNLAFNLPSGDTLTNTGTVTITGAYRQFESAETFSGNLTNQGTINATGTGASNTTDPANMVFASGDTVLNQGKLNVGSGSALTVASGAVFKNQTDGAIANNNAGLSGVGLIVLGTFDQDAGTVSAATGNGPVDLRDGSTLNFTGSGDGAFIAYDADGNGTDSFTVDLSGNLASGQSLAIAVEDFCHGSGTTTIKAAGNFSSAGSISNQYVSSGCNDSNNLAFDLPSGDTLTNTGTITLTGAHNQFSSNETFSGNLTNQGGTFNAGATGFDGANVILANGTFLNEGGVDVLSGSALSVASGAAFTNDTSGLVTNSNSVPSGWPAVGFLVSGTFTQGAGQVATGSGTAPVQLLDTSSLAFTGSGAGDFLAFDSNASGTDSFAVNLSGNIASGQSLDIKVEDFCHGSGTTTIDAAGSFTNAGTISEEYDSQGCNDNNNLAFNLPSGDTLTNTGTITITGAHYQFSSNETFSGNLTNEGGTLNIGESGQDPANVVFAAGDSVVNEGATSPAQAGVVDVLNGSVLTVAGPNNSTVPVTPAASFTNDAGGAINNANTGLTANTTGFVVAGAFTQNAGTVSTQSGMGPVDMIDGSSLAFGGTGGGAFLADDANYNGSDSFTVNLSGDMALQQSLDIKVIDFCHGSGTTTINAAGSFTNAGTISEEYSNPANCNDDNDLAFNLPSGDTLTNTGTISLTGAYYQYTSGDGFTGNLTNQGGTVNIGAVGFDGANASFASGDAILNTGTFNVLSGSALNIQSGASFTNGSGGSVTNANGLGGKGDQPGFLDAGTFEQDAGTVTVGSGDGPVAMRDGSALTFGGTGAGAFAMFDPFTGNDSITTSLAGNLSAGQSLDIKSVDWCHGSGTTTVNAAGSFTNGGTITMDFTTLGSNCNDSNNTALNLPAGDTLTNTGLLSIYGPNNVNASTQTIGGSVDNQGTLSVASSAQAAITGTASATCGSRTVLLCDEAGSTTQANFIGGPNSVPMLTIGSVVLGGTLNFNTDPSFSPSSGQSFNLLSTSSPSGSFAQTSGLSAGGDLAYEPAFNVSNITVTVVDLSTTPYVFRVSPQTGPAGTLVTVFGSDLTGATAVKFGSTPGTNVTPVGSGGTELTVEAPSGPVDGSTRAVTVVTPNGTTETIGAPRFTYATTPSGGADSASLKLTVEDSAGTPLPGVFVGVADGATDNPEGVIVTSSDGTGTLTSLEAGQTVLATVDASLSPYGPANATYELAAGENDETLRLPVQPLVTSDPTLKGPNGNVLAIWPNLLPPPGTTIPGGALSADSTLADMQFTLNYTTGDQVLLAADAAGTQPFCVDGDWTLTLVNSSGASFSTNGSGCPGTGGPLDVGTALNLTTGTYGGELKLVAPQGATTYGASNIYLLPPPGKVSNLQVMPGSVHSQAQFTGAATLDVGRGGQLDVTLGGLPTPGISGYHAIFGFDPSGVMVTGVSFPSGWGGGSRNNFANGDGGFMESTSTNPDNVGDTALILSVTCEKAGSWPISFTGDYWLPSSSAGYADAVEGSATVTCDGPPASSTTSPSGVSIDPNTGDTSVTVTGQNLGTATTAQLLDTSGNVAATSTSVSAQSTVATADFSVVTPGLYDIKLLDGSNNTIAETSGTPLNVAPALPVFSVSPVDLENNIPGIATTHIWSVSNEGTVNGTAVFLFTFPSYMSPEPALDLAGAPTGTQLLTHGLGPNSYYEYVAVPLDAGDSADLAWTVTVPPCAVFGGSGCPSGSPQAPLGSVVPMVAGLAGQFTASEWTAESSKGASTIEADSVADGMSDFTSAVSSIAAMPATALDSYGQSFAYPQLAGAILDLAQSIQQGQALDYFQRNGDLNAGTPPAPPSDWPSPPSSAGPSGQSVDESFGNFVYADGVADADGYYDSSFDGFEQTTVAGGQTPDFTLSPADPNTSASPSRSVLAGSAAGHRETMRFGGSTSTVSADTMRFGGATGVALGQIPAGSSSSTATRRQANPLDDPSSSAAWASDAIWDTATNGVSTSSWSSGISSSVSLLDPDGTVEAAGIPYFQGSGQNELALSNVVFAQPGSGFNGVRSHNIRRTTESSSGWFHSTDPEAAVESGNIGEASLGGLHQGHPGAAGSYPGGNPPGDTGSGPGTTEGSQQNNGAHSVVGSEDPNDITANPSGAGTAGWLTSQPLTYTINFQNEPTATAPAINITVKAKLDANLDPTSLEPGTSSYPATFSYDAATRMMTWYLDGIDLPPDTSPPNGEGYVSFSAQPLSSVTNGTAIAESAQVFFDYNPPVDTPTVTRTVDTVAPTVSDLTHTVNSPTAGKIHLSWSVQSVAGLAYSAIYVSKDNGPFILYATVPAPTTTYDFPYQSGHGYQFEVSAVDVAGLASPLSGPTLSPYSHLRLRVAHGWTTITWRATERVAGFDVYAGGHRLNRRLITSRSRRYAFRVHRVVHHVELVAVPLR